MSKHVRSSAHRASFAVTTSLGAALLLPACAGLGDTISELLSSTTKPEASVTGFQFQDLSLEDLTVLFDVDVKNPYSVPLPLLNLDYELESDGASLLSGAADVAGTVPAEGNRVLQLPAKVVFADALSVLQGLRPGAVVPWKARFNLKVDAPVVGLLELPIETDGELPIPAVPDVTLNQVRIDQLSLQQAKIVLDVGVKNLNDFPVDLTRLDYGFTLAGKEIARSAISQAAELEAGGSGRLEIPISFSLAQLGLAGYSLLSGSGGGYELAGDLDLDTPFGSFAAPYRQSGTVPFVR